MYTILRWTGSSYGCAFERNKVSWAYCLLGRLFHIQTHPMIIALVVVMFSLYYLHEVNASFHICLSLLDINFWTFSLLLGVSNVPWHVYFGNVADIISKVYDEGFDTRNLKQYSSGFHYYLPHFG